MSGLGGDVRVTGRPKAFTAQELALGAACILPGCACRGGALALEEAFGVKIVPNAAAKPGEALMVSVVDEGTPQERVSAVKLCNLDTLFEPDPDRALELRRERAVRTRRLFGFGGPW